ncbi:CRISPR-associated protein Cas4, partial [Candidatus Woesearchaeota archaeon]|nr:CRISPR-associated protein Cas4 [Candidatus Woesearchaeota archaeon]
SVTALSAYLYCRRKLYLEQVLGLKEVPKETVIVGKIRHNVYDLVNRQEKGIVLSIHENNIDQIEEKYKTNYSNNLKNSIKLNKTLLHNLKFNLSDVYRQLWPTFLEESRIRAAALRGFVEKNKIFGPKLWERLTPKIESEVFVSSKELELKGKIDRIEKHDDKIVPIELKTGKAPRESVWEGHLIQIGAYMMLLEEQFQKPVNDGMVEYLTEKIKRPVKMNPFLKNDILKLKEEVKELLASDKLPEITENKNKCKICGLRDECYRLN